MDTMPAPKSSPDGSRAHRSRAGEPRPASPAGAGEGLASLVEQLVNRVVKPLGLVVLTRERIEVILDDAAERGRMTRSDAEALAAELVKRGRQQTDQFLSDLERVLDRGRQELGTATRRVRHSESMDRLIRSADRAPTGGAGQSVPILGYEDLTATQVQQRLDGLTSAELRNLGEYERRHANRKSVLSAIDRALASD
jgi:polyhydroxyalkanoate synthesis regulator phasin